MAPRMRTAILLLATLALAMTAAPAAEATHMGPCTHEYFDYFFAYGVKGLLFAVVACAKYGTGDVSEAIVLA